MCRPYRGVYLNEVNIARDRAVAPHRPRSGFASGWLSCSSAFERDDICGQGMYDES
jgi:hypothetical protein